MSVLKPLNLIEAEILKIVRKNQGISQQELAEAIGSHNPRVSHAENGKKGYYPHEVKRIKKLLKIENMPTTQEDRLAFVDQILTWRDRLPTLTSDEIKDVIKEFEPILNMQCADAEVACYYRLFLVPAFIRIGEFEKARQEMAYIKAILNEDNPQHMYHYNLNLMAICGLDLDYVSSIRYGKKAIKIATDNKELLLTDVNRAKYNMANHYTYLHRPLKAIIYLRDVNCSNIESRTDLFPLQADVKMLLGLNYARAGNHEDAEDLLKEALRNLKSHRDKFFMGLAMYNYGAIKQLSKKWKQSRKYFKEATQYLPLSSIHHFWCVYGDIQSAIMCEDLAEAKEMLKEAKKNSKNYPDQEMVEVLFKYLYYIRIIIKGGTIFREDEVTFILEKVIPLFLKHHMKFEAMWACDILSTHYSKARKERQSAEMYVRSLEIHKTLLISE